MTRILVALFLLATANSESNAADPAAQRAAEKLAFRISDTPVAIEKNLQTTPVPEVLAELSKKYDVTFVVSSRVVGLKQAKAAKLDKPKLEAMPLDAFLTAYLKGLSIPGITFVVRPDYIELLTEAAQAREKAERNNSADHIVDVLHNARIEMQADLQTAPFSEVIAFLAKKYEVQFIVDKTALGDAAVQLDTARAEKLSVSSLNGLSVAAFLRIYLRSLPVEGVAYLVKADHIEITSREEALRTSGLLEAVEQASIEGNKKQLVAAQARLNLPLVCLAAKERTLGDILKELKRVYGINIVVDPSAKEAMKTPLSLDLLNVPADTAMEVLAAQAGASLVRKGNVFMVGWEQ